MNGRRWTFALLFGLVLLGTGLAQLRPAAFADPARGMPPQDMSSMDQGIPSYHAYLPRPPIPTTLDPKQFPDFLNQNVYALAAKIVPVLYEQPCYCYCDRHFGHKSLLDCFAGKHGAECDVCQKEAVLAYQMTQKGKNPAQIRAAIIRGEWKNVNMNSYMSSVVVH